MLKMTKETEEIKQLIKEIDLQIEENNKFVENF